jgi:hypothetical protein
LPQIREKTFLISGTFYRPFCGDIRQIKVKLWSGGSSGNWPNGTSDYSGGHGGGYAEIFYKLNDLPLFNSLIIGAGGATVPSGSVLGIAGGDTIFNFTNTVFGARAPNKQSNNAYQYGDFMTGNINPSVVAPVGYDCIGTIIPDNGAGYINNFPDMWSGGRGAILDINIAAGNNQDFTAANTIFGGAGGALSSSGFTNGGTSLFGGNGGDGNPPRTPDIVGGKIPGGGGAGGVTSGAGGQGQITIEYW